MAVEYKPVPKGSYRPFMSEYMECKRTKLPSRKLVEYTAHAARYTILNDINQTHFILEERIPHPVLEGILKRVELDSMAPNEKELPVLIPYSQFTVEECKEMHKKPFYEKFYQSVADKILFAEIFKDNERYKDMAKWIKHNFDKFVLFDDGNDISWMFDEEVMKKKRNLESQVFIKADHSNGFVKNLGYFIDFFTDKGYNMHPIIHLGTDAPVYTQQETRKLCERFSKAVEGMELEELRKTLDGKDNNERLKEYNANFLDHCTDPDPDELIRLADIANTLYHDEWCFMYQGAPSRVSVALPRWVITLEEEFAGNWSGSFHPLLKRGLNADAYNEESVYISHIRC